MGRTIRLGRIAGVKVGLNWSLLVIFGLIVWGLASTTLPQRYLGEAEAVYWVVAVLTATTFFVSLLAHEMGHALVAQKEGVEVEDVTLWLFGGIARLRGEAPDPGAEFRIAIVGPVISLAIAGVMYLAVLMFEAIDAPPIVVSVPSWLARINTVLALFNLVPAFPLDGGRVLRALLWRRQGRVRATVGAARIGRVFAFLMMGFGSGQFIFQEDLGGLWLVFLGWFLLSAARSEQTRAHWRGILEGVTASDAMTIDLEQIPDWMTVQAFIDNYVAATGRSAYALRDIDGEVTGLVTLEHLRKVRPDRRGSARLSEIACPLAEVPQARPDDDLLELLGRASGCAGGRAFVMDEGRLLGMVTPEDVERLLTAHKDESERVSGSPPSRYA